MDGRGWGDYDGDGDGDGARGILVDERQASEPDRKRTYYKGLVAWHLTLRLFDWQNEVGRKLF